MKNQRNRGEKKDNHCYWKHQKRHPKPIVLVAWKWNSFSSWSGWKGKRAKGATPVHLDLWAKRGQCSQRGDDDGGDDDYGGNGDCGGDDGDDNVGDDGDGDGGDDQDDDSNDVDHDLDQEGRSFWESLFESCHSCAQGLAESDYTSSASGTE